MRRPHGAGIARPKGLSAIDSHESDGDRCLATSAVTRNRPYGAKEARVFLREVLPEAPQVPVQIAHLSGSGGYDDPAIDEALGVFVDAVAKHDPRMSHVYFDISGITGIGHWQGKSELIASRIRQLGLGRILFGSDGNPRKLSARVLDAISSVAPHGR